MPRKRTSADRWFATPNEPRAYALERIARRLGLRGQLPGSAEDLADHIHYAVDDRIRARARAIGALEILELLNAHDAVADIMSEEERR
jgi:hypothetical protein